MQKYLSKFDGLDKLRYSRHLRLHVLCCVYITIPIPTSSLPIPSLLLQNRAHRCVVYIANIDEPLANAAPMARQLMTSTKTSPSQCSSSKQVTHIHTYMQGPDILKSISCVLIA